MPAIRYGMVVLCAVPCASAHTIDTLASSGRYPAWSLEPWVLACLALSATLYAIGITRVWRRAGIGRGIGIARALAFAGGWITLVVALVSPLDPLGVQLFSAHMVQHELLMVVAAPLLVTARPLAAWTWALPKRARQRLGARLRNPAWRAAWRAIRAPLTAWWLHAAALWLWHAPVLFQAALVDDTWHTIQHLSFLGTALLFWWATLAATTRKAQGAALLYLFATMVHSGALGALLTFSPHLWYPEYARSTEALGFDALRDQQLGGLLMWVPAGLVYLGIGVALAARWMDLGFAAARVPAARPKPSAR